jgi:RNA polymerase sigma-70 factor (sigma-E family)
LATPDVPYLVGPAAAQLVTGNAPPPAPAAGPQGFAVAFPTLFTLAYKVAYRILGDRGDAEDVAQEALARAALRWRRLAPRPEGWVVRVAGNLAIDRYRRRRRVVMVAVEPGVAAEPLVAERLDLAGALGALPRRQRQVVVLRYLADWSEQDVARALGCSVGTVKSSGARGVQALRRRLGGRELEDGDVRTP